MSTAKRRRTGVAPTHLADGCPISLDAITRTNPSRIFDIHKTLDPETATQQRVQLSERKQRKRRGAVSPDESNCIFIGNDDGTGPNPTVSFGGKVFECPLVQANNFVSTAQFADVIPNKHILGMVTAGGTPPTDKSLKSCWRDGYLEMNLSSPTVNISGAQGVLGTQRLISDYVLANARSGLSLRVVRQSIAQIQCTFRIFGHEEGMGIDIKRISVDYKAADYSPEQINRVCFRTTCNKGVLLFGTGACVIHCCTSVREAQITTRRLFRWLAPYFCERKVHKK